MKKFQISNFKFQIVGAVGVLLLAASALAGPPTFQTNSINIASALASVNAGTSNSVAGTPFPVPQGVPLNIDFSFVAANGGTSNTTFGLNVSSDGVHYSTTLPFGFGAACNGTTAVIGHTNIAASALAGIQFLRLDQVITTQTNAVTITALYTGLWQ